MSIRVRLTKASRFRVTAQNVHALDRLAAGAFGILSIALKAMSRPVRLSSRQAISITLLPVTVLGVGQRFSFQQTDKRLGSVS